MKEEEAMLANSASCIYMIHDDASHGLGWKDQHELFGEDQVEVRTSWKSPTEAESKAHTAHINKIQTLDTAGKVSWKMLLMMKTQRM